VVILVTCDVFAGAHPIASGGSLVLSGLLVVALTSLIIGTVYLVDGLAPWLPPAKKLGSIFKYLAFADAVFCGAWGGKSTSLRKTSAVTLLWRHSFGLPACVLMII
jgi:hypothetical protein